MKTVLFIFFLETFWYSITSNGKCEKLRVSYAFTFICGFSLNNTPLPVFNLTLIKIFINTNLTMGMSITMKKWMNAKGIRTLEIVLVCAGLAGWTRSGTGTSAV